MLTPSIPPSVSRYMSLSAAPAAGEGMFDEYCDEYWDGGMDRWSANDGSFE